MTSFTFDSTEADLWDASLAPVAAFRDEFEFLSNFYPSVIWTNGLPWRTAEHLYQGCKTLDFTLQEDIRLAPTPGGAKHRGRSVPIRFDWERIKDQTMHSILTLKFPRDPDDDLTQRLIATGRRPLIEGNWWHDNYWGVCSCRGPRCSGGRNRLGILLMRRRAELLS